MDRRFSHVTRITGNFRTFAFYDILRRWLQSGAACASIHVMNITDVEDKIIRNALAEGKSLVEYTAIYEKAFLEDCAAVCAWRNARAAGALPSIFRRWRKRFSNCRRKTLHGYQSDLSYI